MKTKDLAAFGLLTALALILSYVESLLPSFVPIPGIKLGLANIAVVFALYRLGGGRAALLSVTRVLLASFLFGNAYTLMYSLTGAALSLLAMIFLQKTGRFTSVGVSLAGAVAHNLGQILVAVLVMGTGTLWHYLPALIISGLAAGVVIGLAAGALVRRMKGFL